MRHRPLRLGHAGTMLATQAASCHKQVQRPSGIALLERDRRRASAVLRHRRPSPKPQPKPSMTYRISCNVCIRSIGVSIPAFMHATTWAKMRKLLGRHGKVSFPVSPIIPTHASTLRRVDAWVGMIGDTGKNTFPCLPNSLRIFAHVVACMNAGIETPILRIQTLHEILYVIDGLGCGFGLGRRCLRTADARRRSRSNKAIPLGRCTCL